jgi:sigma-E factor negative regulatory protein RseA
MASGPLAEMISAVVDGEASEFEYRKVLDGLSEADVRGHIGRQYAMRAVIRGEADHFCPAALTGRILLAVGNEPPLSRVEPARWRRPMIGIAVAASVCMVAVLGSRWAVQNDAQPEAALAAAAVVPKPASLGELGQSAQRTTAVSSVAGVGFGSAVPVAAGSIPDPAATANRRAEQRLQRYLLEHENSAALGGNQGVLPYARVVDYESLK